MDDKYRVMKWPWGGFIIQKYTTKVGYWFNPMNETTYDVLDSETPTTYKTKEEAEKRINVLTGRS